MRAKHVTVCLAALCFGVVSIGLAGPTPTPEVYWDFDDLVEMLRPCLPNPVMLLVADAYRCNGEIRAYPPSVAGYLCTPLAASWLHAWHPAPRPASAAIRGPPP
jgi:hypothetical protein